MCASGRVAEDNDELNGYLPVDLLDAWDHFVVPIKILQGGFSASRISSYSPEICPGIPFQAAPVIIIIAEKHWLFAIL